MKKSLLKWAVIIHAIMYSVSLLYIGYKFGILLPYPDWPELFIFPAIDLFFLGISIYLVREREYLESKHYFWIGFVTLGFGIWKLGSRLFFYYQGMIEEYVDYYVHPIVTFCLYFIVSIIYFTCARITRKEAKSK